MESMFEYFEELIEDMAEQMRGSDVEFHVSFSLLQMIAPLMMN